MWKLYGIMVLITLSESKSLNQTLQNKTLIHLYSDDCMNGYDGSLMSSINAMPPFHAYFGVAMQGGRLGILFAIYSIGGLIGSVAAAPGSDMFGRKFGMLIGFPSSFWVRFSKLRPNGKNLASSWADDF
jgi:MFS family permease